MSGIYKLAPTLPVITVQHDIDLEDMMENMNRELCHEMLMRLIRKDDQVIPLLREIHRVFALRGDAPQALRDFLYLTFDRIL